MEGKYEQGASFSGNPIEPNRAAGVQLPAGTYQAKFGNLETKMYPTWDDKSVLEKKIVATFEIETEEGTAFVSTFMRPVLGKRANLTKFLTAIGASSEVLASHELAWEFLQSMKDKEFLVMVTPKGEYNRFMGIAPLPSNKGKIKVTQQPASFQEDDIPF